jgi:hypothetical protein
MEIMEVDVKIPIIVKRETNRANYPSTSDSGNERDDVVSYWRKSVYIPILDQVITDLKQRFSDDAMPFFFIESFIARKK